MFLSLHCKIFKFTYGDCWVDELYCCLPCGKGKMHAYCNRNFLVKTISLFSITWQISSNDDIYEKKSKHVQKDERKNKDSQYTMQKTKDCHTPTPLKIGLNTGIPKWWAAPVPWIRQVRNISVVICVINHVWGL